MKNTLGIVEEYIQLFHRIICKHLHYIFKQFKQVHLKNSSFSGLTIVVYERGLLLKDGYVNTVESNYLFF